MTSRTTPHANELRTLLVSARIKAEQALHDDPLWRALAELEAAHAEPRQTAGLREALRGNPLLAVMARVDEALALLAADADAHADAATGPSAAAGAALMTDDLTRIRGLSPAMAVTLKRIGITSFRQIADWTAADVRAAIIVLGPEAPIHRRAWIEQAAMLAARAGAAVAAPPQPAERRAPAASVTHDGAAASARHDGAITSGDVRVAGTAGATVPAAAPATNLRTVVASALAGIIAKVPAGAAPTERVSASPADAPPAPGPAAAIEGTAPSEPSSPSRAEPLAATTLVQTTLAQTTLAERRAEPPPAPVAPADDLLSIAGLDEVTVRHLDALGVRRFADIAAWTARDVVTCEVRLLQPLRVRRQGWIEQAALLAAGTETAFASRRRQGLLSALAPAPRDAPWLPMPLVPAAAATAHHVPAPVAVAAPADAAASVATASTAKTGHEPIGPAPDLATVLAGVAPASATVRAAPEPAPATTPAPATSADMALASLIRRPPAPAAPITAALPPATSPAIAPAALPPPPAPPPPAPTAARPAAPQPEPPVPAPSSAAPTADAIAAPLSLPPLFAPEPGSLAASLVAAPQAAVVTAPMPPPPAVRAAREAEATAGAGDIAPADRLESCGSDLSPGMAAALASAAATGMTLAENPPRAPRRPLATPLPERQTGVDLRQWRNDTEAELGAIAAPPDDGKVAASLAADASPFDQHDAQPELHDDDGDDASLGDEADVVIVAHGDDDSPGLAALPSEDLSPAAALPGAGAPAPQGQQPAAPSLAERIRARSRQLASLDDDETAGRPVAATGGIEEASVEIVVRDGDGGPHPAPIAPAADKPNARGGSGLSQLVKALTRDTDRS